METLVLHRVPALIYHRMQLNRFSLTRHVYRSRSLAPTLKFLEVFKHFIIFSFQTLSLCLNVHSAHLNLHVKML